MAWLPPATFVTVVSMVGLGSFRQFGRRCAFWGVGATYDRASGRRRSDHRPEAASDYLGGHPIEQTPVHVRKRSIPSPLGTGRYVRRSSVLLRPVGLGVGSRRCSFSPGARGTGISRRRDACRPMPPADARASGG